jgi:hypothetical protein
VLPEKERITLDLDVTTLVIEGMRRMDAQSALRGRELDGYLVLERGAPPSDGLLQPWEAHVLSLVDGEKTVLELCHESEAGETETQKTLAAFLATGVVRSRGRKVRALDQDFVPEDTELALVDSFNKMYRQVLGYMVREVGPIAESVLNKYLGTVRQARPEVFENVALKSDGALDEAAVERNLARLAPDRRRPALVDALNELLYSELLAVKRTLGPDHETALVRELRPPR